jgi:hypothetical protein
MFKQLRFAAVPLIAGAIIVLTTASVWAFTQQILGPNGNYNFNYGDPDDKAKLDDSTKKFDSTNSTNSPSFHFSIEHDQTAPFGFHSFGGSSNATPPDFYQPHGNGN